MGLTVPTIRCFAIRSTQRMYDLLDYFRWHTSVPTKLNEMVDPHHGPAVALAGGMVRPCTFGEESWPDLESQHSTRRHEP